MSHLLIYSMLLMFLTVSNLVRRKRYDYSVIFVLITSVFSIVAAFYSIHIFSFFTTGFVWGGNRFYGTIFVMPIFLIIYALITKKNVIKFLSYVTLNFPVCHGLQKLQCYNNGCCGGKTFSWYLGGEVAFPIQIVECFLYIGVTVVLLILEAKWFKKNKYQNLDKMFSYVIFIYAPTRIFAEFFRSTNAIYFGLTNWQWWSFVAIALGVVMVLVYNYYHNKSEKFREKRKFIYYRRKAV